MGMTKFQRRYVATETLISMAINCAISVGMFVLLFGGRAEISLKGLDGALIDFIPQTFMIALMSLVVPTLLTRRRVARGRIGSIGGCPASLADQIVHPGLARCGARNLLPRRNRIRAFAGGNGGNDRFWNAAHCEMRVWRARGADRHPDRGGERRSRIGRVSPEHRIVSDDMNIKLYLSPGSCARVPLIALEQIGRAVRDRRSWRS